METPASNPNPRLLLIDDEPHITHVLGRKLRKLGAEVDVARNGSEGLDKAIASVPSLILSDLQMTRLDGLEMALKLAEHTSTADVPIVMISGRGFLLDDKRVRQTRIIEVLEKPFSVAAVIDIVSRVLSWTPPGEIAA